MPQATVCMPIPHRPFASLVEMEVYNNDGSGIYAAVPVGVISHSQVYKNRGSGIHVASTLDDLSHSQVFNNDSHGVYVASEVGSLSDNTIYNNDGDGVHLLSAGDAHIEGNEVYWHGGFGLYVLGDDGRRRQRRSCGFSGQQGVRQRARRDCCRRRHARGWQYSIWTHPTHRHTGFRCPVRQGRTCCTATTSESLPAGGVSWRGTACTVTAAMGFTRPATSRERW